MDPETRSRKLARSLVDQRLDEVYESGRPCDRDLAELLVATCIWLDRAREEQPLELG